jgi:hypothetical protein
LRPIKEMRVPIIIIIIVHRMVPKRSASVTLCDTSQILSLLKRIASQHDWLSMASMFAITPIVATKSVQPLQLCSRTQMTQSVAAARDVLSWVPLEFLRNKPDWIKLHHNIYSSLLPRHDKDRTATSCAWSAFRKITTI